MPVATFDTLKFANTLKAAGVPPQQAEAEAAAFAEVIQLNFKDLVTKDDLKSSTDALRLEIAQLGKDLRQEAKDTEKSLRQEVKDAEQRLSSKVDALAATTDVRFAKVYGELVLIRWMLGVLIGGVLALIVRSFFFRGTL